MIEKDESYLLIAQSKTYIQKLVKKYAQGFFSSIVLMQQTQFQLIFSLNHGHLENIDKDKIQITYIFTWYQ